MDWSLDKENKIVQEAKKNPESFGLLYERYFEPIYRYVFRRVNDTETAEDLVSQTFFDALNNIALYQPKGYPFSAWLYKIAHNNVLKWYRKNNRTTKVDLEDIAELRSDEDLTEQISVMNDAEILKSKLAMMEWEEQEIIRLKYLEGQSNQEIAQILGVTANNVGVKLFRSLKQLKQLLSYE